MILTCKKRIPAHWIAFAVLPLAASTFKEGVMGTALIFSLKKFVDNPAGLTLILSLPWFISLFTAPVCNFLSDRIWTRFGRRKPFVATSSTATLLLILLMPLMPNLWALIAVYMVHGLFADVGSPLEPLKQEIVPPQQRGRAAAGMTWCSNIANITFYSVALGRFDDVVFMAGFPLSGEKAIYWTSCLMSLVIVMLITLGIREVNQHSALCGERFSLRNFVRGVLDSNLWPVYVLIFGSAMMGAGLGPLGNLLYTEQWGYSKQLMGTNIAIGGVLNIFLIILLGIFADKLNRIRAYQTLICISIVLNVLYYCYVKFVLLDHRPTLVEMVIFGETMTIVYVLTGLVYMPMVYDFIRRNQMGTYSAGAGMVNRLTGIFTVNGVGLFVWGYAVLFQPPAGDMTRVVLRDEVWKDDVTAIVQGAQWKDPQSGAPVDSKQVWAGEWNALGLTPPSGHCWEIRLRNKDSQNLAAEKEELLKERSPILTEEQILRDKAEKLAKKGKAAESEKARQSSQAKSDRCKAIDARIREIDATLLARAENFRGQVECVFGGRIIADGEQILAAGTGRALLVELPISSRPVSTRLEAILEDLRDTRPEVIDLRPIRIGQGYGLAVSAVLAPGTDEAGLARSVQEAVSASAAHRDARLFKQPAGTPRWSHTSTLTMQLPVVEPPLDTHFSPVTRVVNWLLAFFDSAPTADRRIAATARSLRLAGQTEHVRIEEGANGAKAISVVALLHGQATKAATLDDGVGRRLQSLLGGDAAGVAAQARVFYGRVVKAATSQRLTVFRPNVETAYTPMKYDYMSGYIWMFFMGLCGLGITIAFLRQVKKGRIRRLGLEEAEAGAQNPAAPASAAVSAEEPGPVLYIPGYGRAKAAVIVVGLAIFAFGISQLWTPMRLLATGGAATAEATRVIKTKEGVPDIVLTDDLQIQAHHERKDLSHFFWNEFHFNTAEGRDMTLRCPIASHLKPLFTLVDEEGLPTSLPVRYDQKRPEIVTFPTIISTWFVPGILTVVGMVLTALGGFLLFWAGKPIEVPYFPPRTPAVPGEPARAQ